MAERTFAGIVRERLIIALRSRNIGVGFAVGIGLLLTVGAFLCVCGWEYRIATIDFTNHAKAYLELVDAELAESRTLMYTIATFIGSTDRPVTASEFARFATASHHRVGALRDVAWAPLVTAADRAAFEENVRRAGLSDYSIKELAGPVAGGKLVRAAVRTRYYPILYNVVRGRAAQGLLGLDLTFSRARADIAARAIRLNAPAATPPMDVRTIKEPGAGVLSYIPVFRAARDGRAQLSGLVLGVFDIADIVATSIRAHRTLNDLHLYVFNPNAVGSRRILYQTPTTASERDQAPSERVLEAGVHWQNAVVIIDQHIGAIVTPAQPLRFLRVTVFGVTTIIVGLAFTAMSVAWVLVSLRRILSLETLTASLELSGKQIGSMSRHDRLTELPNRWFFHERIDAEVLAFRSDSPFALLFLDLDRFKTVNDTLGHSVGDRLLCIVAQRIVACLREEDMAARLGGDEFAVIVADASDGNTTTSIARRLIESLRAPYVIDGQTMHIGASIGLATATNGVTSEDLIAQADLAMYEAKRNGRGTYCLFEPQLRSRVEEKRTLETDLRLALERNEFEIHYQPIINLATNRVSCFEALVRWEHPTRGLCLPDTFLPIAEECGMIGQLGRWILQRALRDAATWPADVKLAVNISPIQLREPSLTTEIVDSLRSFGVVASRLELELTEAAVIEHRDATILVLNELRSLGITIAFDDFGTGFSSLASILRFSFDKIKIDRSFLRDVDTSPSAAALVQAVVGLGATLGVTTTGEGVETFQQLAYLRQCGCTEAQGYVFCQPGPNSDVKRMLRTLDHPGMAVPT